MKLTIKRLAFSLLVLLVGALAVHVALSAHAAAQAARSERPGSSAKERLAAHANAASAQQSQSGVVQSSSAAEFGARTALCSLAFGAAAAADARNLLRSLAHARHASTPLAAVVVVTDQPDAFDASMLSDAGAVAVPLSALGFELPHVPRPVRDDGSRISERRQRKMQIKWLKTQLVRIVDAAIGRSRANDAPRIDHVVFVDADIVLGGPLSLFLQAARVHADAPLTTFPDTGHTGSPYHTGVLLETRGRSDRLMEKWAEAITSGHFKGDQEALQHVVQKHKLESKVHLFNPDRVFSFIEAPLMAARRRVVFVHCSKYRLENPRKFQFSLADVRYYMDRVVDVDWDSDVAPVDKDVDPNDFIVYADLPAARAPTARNTALVSIAVGEKSRAFGRLLIRSFALHGEFAGPLYIVTDDAEYFQTDVPDLTDADDDDDDARKAVRRRHAKKAIGLPRNVHFLRFGNGTCGDNHFKLPDVAVHLKKKAGSGDGKAAIIAKNLADGKADKELLNSHNRERLQIKWIKTQFFRLLPSSIRFAMFLDSDMIVERPLRYLLNDCFRVQTNHKPTPVLTLYKDFGASGMPYHTGVMFMSREHSQPLLDAWGQHILAGWTKSDQKCLNRTVNEMRLAKRIGFLDTEIDNFAFINGTIVNEGKIFTLLHATFYRLSMADKFDFTREAFQKYLQEKARLSARGAVLSLVPDAVEVARRQADRAQQKRKGTRDCKYIQTSWLNYVVQWCP